MWMIYISTDVCVWVRLQWVARSDVMCVWVRLLVFAVSDFAYGGLWSGCCVAAREDAVWLRERVLLCNKYADTLLYGKYAHTVWYVSVYGGF